MKPRTPLNPRKKPLKRTGAPKRKTAVKKVNTARLAKRKKAYDAYMRSPEWQALRNVRMQYDTYTCQRCGYVPDVRYSPWEGGLICGPKALHVHHKTYARFGGKELLEDLETLCADCHGKEHAGRFIIPRGLRK